MKYTKISSTMVQATPYLPLQVRFFVRPQLLTRI
jgi:hypothetical protein